MEETSLNTIQLSLAMREPERPTNDATLGGEQRERRGKNPLVDKQSNLSGGSSAPVMKPINEFWHVLHQKGSIHVDGVPGQHAYPLCGDPFLDIRENRLLHVRMRVRGREACISQARLWWKVNFQGKSGRCFRRTHPGMLLRAPLSHSTRCRQDLIFELEGEKQKGEDQICLNAPIQDLLVCLNHKLDPFIDQLQVPVGYDDLSVVKISPSPGISRGVRTAISIILSLRGSNPVISQSTQTSGPALKSSGLMVINERWMMAFGRGSERRVL